jgi:hypothetical protein
MCELCNMSYRVGKACQLCLLNQHQHPWCWFQVRINRIRPTSYVGGLAERGGEGWWSHMRSWNRAWMRYISADIIFYKLAKHMKQIFPFQNVHSFITIPTLQSKVTQLCDWNKIVHKMMHRILLNLCVCVCVCVFLKAGHNDDHVWQQNMKLKYLTGYLVFTSKVPQEPK